MMRVFLSAIIGFYVIEIFSATNYVFYFKWNDEISFFERCLWVIL